MFANRTTNMSKRNIEGDYINANDEVDYIIDSNLKF